MPEKQAPKPLALKDNGARIHETRKTTVQMEKRLTRLDSLAPGSRTEAAAWTFRDRWRIFLSAGGGGGPRGWHLNLTHT